MLMVMSTLDIKELKKSDFVKSVSVAICKTPHPDQSE